jgi:site-specific DNA recombinase
VRDYEYENRTNAETEKINNLLSELHLRESSLKENLVQIEKERDKLVDSFTRIDSSSSMADTLSQRIQVKYEQKEKEIGDCKRQIDSLLKEIAAADKRLKSINARLRRESLTEVSDKEMSEIYKKVLSRVVYYSVNYRKGFVVIDYKNGVRNIVAILKGRKRTAILLPSTFTFNEESRTVSTLTGSVFPKFSFGEASLSVDDIMADKELHEWELKL